MPDPLPALLCRSLAKARGKLEAAPACHNIPRDPNPCEGVKPWRLAYSTPRRVVPRLPIAGAGQRSLQSNCPPSLLVDYHPVGNINLIEAIRGNTKHIAQIPM